MAVHAPDSSKEMDLYEPCVSSVTRVFREGRRGGAKRFYITGDLNVELGMTWRLWCSIMKEFNCKESSTWPYKRCGIYAQEAW